MGHLLVSHFILLHLAGIVLAEFSSKRNYFQNDWRRLAEKIIQMPQYNIPKQLSGLTGELKNSREKFGFNQAENTIKSAWYTLLFDILKEPMLLFANCRFGDLCL